MVIGGYGQLLMVMDSNRWLWRQLMAKYDSGWLWVVMDSY